jgi:hypothetical protein
MHDTDRPHARENDGPAWRAAIQDRDGGDSSYTQKG